MGLTPEDMVVLLAGKRLLMFSGAVRNRFDKGGGEEAGVSDGSVVSCLCPLSWRR